jgi:hypothetical protein
MDKVILARQLGISLGFWDVMETGRRGCDLDFLPRIAAALKLDPKVVTKVYLSERHPKLCHALFDEPIKGWQFDVKGVVVEDVHWRLDQLPRRQRSIVEALIYLLYDLSLAPQTEGDRTERS